MKNLLVAGALMLALVGCGTTSGTVITPTQLAKFEKGVTTPSDVILVLGKPNTTVSGSDGTKVMSYVYMKTSVKGATFVPVVGLFAGGAASNISSTTFSFDASGLLVSYQSIESAYDSRNTSSQ